MSGPKVVRIVTREEIVGICRGHLARVDAALDEWIRVGRRNECVDEAAVEAARRRRDALAAMIDRDRFMDLQKQAPVEEAFLRHDIQDRLVKAAQATAAERTRERRGLEAGASVLRSLEKAGPVPPELAHGLRQGDETALAVGLRLLSTNVAVPTASAELARSLREEGSPRTFHSWLTDRAGEHADPEVERLEMRLVELSQHVAREDLSDMRSRLDEAVTADGARRSLLLDGLGTEMAKALRDLRARAELQLELRLASAELEAMGEEPPAARQDVNTASPESLQAAIAETRSIIEGHRAAAAARSRRAAVLKGLAQLGYEVTEGMTTQHADDGRLVLRSAARPDYGVEVAAAGARMQIRPVAFEAGVDGPDPSRDRDAETIWCGDVAALQSHLARQGGGLEIEKALPVGAVPLKRIALHAAADAQVATAPVARTRELRK